VEAVAKAVQALPQSDAVAGLGASAGVACFPDDAEDAQELIARADDALYRVKEGGRGHAARASND
jgi:diguanylate cyclase (GGDEF)-like protein